MPSTHLTATTARAKADKCRKAAELTSDQGIRAGLLSLAAMFDEKARKLGRNLDTTNPNES